MPDDNKWGQGDAGRTYNGPGGRGSTSGMPRKSSRANHLRAVAVPKEIAMALIARLKGLVRAERRAGILPRGVGLVTIAAVSGALLFSLPMKVHAGYGPPPPPTCVWVSSPFGFGSPNAARVNVYDAKVCWNGYTVWNASAVQCQPAAIPGFYAKVNWCASNASGTTNMQIGFNGCFTSDDPLTWWILHNDLWGRIYITNTGHMYGSQGSNPWWHGC